MLMIDPHVRDASRALMIAKGKRSCRTPLPSFDCPGCVWPCEYRRGRLGETISICEGAVRQLEAACCQKLDEFRGIPFVGRRCKVENGWISVNERLPVNGDYVLVHKASTPSVVQAVFYQSGAENPFYDSRDGLRLYGIRHWMPLPSPPPAVPTKDEAIRDALAFLEIHACTRVIHSASSTYQNSCELARKLRDALEGR